MSDHKIPNILRIVDGELQMADGSDVKAYLRSFAEAMGIDEMTPVNLVRHEMLCDVHYKALMYEAMTSG